jgi:hypothetical protein
MQVKRVGKGSVLYRLRIFVDYTQLYVGGTTEVNLIKRVTNITANYFAKVLTVKRLERLYFPEGTSRQCKHISDAGNSLMIPEEYVTDGTIGDIGVVCGNENNPNAVYVAKSTPCAFLESDNRPIWGMMSWNVPFLKYDQEGFQQNVFVGVCFSLYVVDSLNDAYFGLFCCYVSTISHW